LLQSGAGGEVVRMHRLHQAHLREMTPAADAAAIRDAVAGHLIRTVGRVAIDEGDTTPWECAALTDALLLWAHQDPRVAEAANSGRLFRRLVEFVGDDRPLVLAQTIVKLCAQRHQQHPGSTEITLDLARALGSAGRLLRSWRPADAVAAHEQALVLAEQAQVNDDSVQTRRMLSVALNNLAAAVEFSEPEWARVLFERDCAIAEALATEYPEHVRLRVDYWLSLNSLGRAVEEVDSAGALNLFERGLSIIEQLAADAPEDTRLWRELSLSLQNVARVCEVRDPGRARSLYERDLDLVQRRSVRRPDDLMAQRDLSVTHLCLARSHLDSDPAAARLHTSRAVEIRESLRTRRPGSLAAARDLVVALNLLGRVDEGEDPDRAGAAYARALAVALEVVDADPGSPLAVREVAVCRTNLARMVWAQDQESAIGQMELACAEMELVCERLPGNGRFEAELQVVRELLAASRLVPAGPTPAGHACATSAGGAATIPSG
jgi:hypothetical protein